MTGEENSFFIKLPCFMLVRENGNGPLVFPHEDITLIPLFTDDDLVVRFLEKSGFKAEDAGILIVKTPSELRQTLQGFPAAVRDGKHLVIMDPIDTNPRTVIGYSIQRLLASIIR